MLKNKTIHSIFVKGENGFPLQATCFPVGERRAASAPFRGSPVSLSPFHSNSYKCFFLARFSTKVKLFTTLYGDVLSLTTSSH
ncbi:hypothetical protein CRI88_13135 [Lysinibacillus fusiformis]|uniref:Uncharacterized protein n=1 Tax=Lysinibacillus fusiformis TaxID=28031 RepID=A0A2I0V082_9BACI|nr:hypothetical protein CRI88_13135 [Lysinibacillus fusiformis]